MRVTMLSLLSMIFSLSMMVIFPLTGYLIDKLGFVSSFFYIGLTLLVVSLFLVPLCRRLAARLKI